MLKLKRYMKEYANDIIKEKREKAKEWKDCYFDEEKALTEIYKYFSLYQMGLIRDIDVMDKLVEIHSEDQIITKDQII